MLTKNENENLQAAAEKSAADQTKRSTLRKLGRFAAVTPPLVALILAAKTKPAAAAGSGGASSRQFKEPVSVPQLSKAVA